MNTIKRKKLLEKLISALLTNEEGEPANVSGGVEQVNAPLSKKIVKRRALELEDEEDEVDAEEVPSRH